MNPDRHADRVVHHGVFRVAQEGHVAEVCVSVQASEIGCEQVHEDPLGSRTFISPPEIDRVQDRISSLGSAGEDQFQLERGPFVLVCSTRFERQRPEFEGGRVDANIEQLTVGARRMACTANETIQPHAGDVTRHDVPEVAAAQPDPLPLPPQHP